MDFVKTMTKVIEDRDFKIEGMNVGQRDYEQEGSNEMEELSLPVKINKMIKTAKALDCFDDNEK